jgi:hypothetical protein
MKKRPVTRKWSAEQKRPMNMNLLATQYKRNGINTLVITKITLLFLRWVEYIPSVQGRRLLRQHRRQGSKAVFS